MERSLSRLVGLALVAALLAGGGSCRRSGAPAGALKKKPGEKVGRIVFVGQKGACDCTKNRVKETWSALQFALQKHQAVKVERLALDVDGERVRALKRQRRFMVVPALYFFSPAGKLVAMLEGELKPDQIAQNLE
jgi:hypothetical protein